MNESAIDPIAAPLWIVYGVALLLIVPLTEPLWRKFAYSFVNVGFLAIILQVKVVAVLVALVAFWLALRYVYGRKRCRFSIGLTIVVLGLLFLIHKRPAESAELGFGATNSVLSIIGYSYVVLRQIDVLRAVVEGRRHAPDFLSLINYLVPFHMLPAGPVQTYDDYITQPSVPDPLDLSSALEGIDRIISGLFKKFVLAYAIEKLLLTGFHAEGWYLALEAQVFFCWLYLDFSAYSDIAVGMGRLLGIATPENFNRPYLATNVINFWERWHISLSQWVRTHLFTPMQLALARRATGKAGPSGAGIAFFASFVGVGAWHGLTWPCLVWGLFHACGLWWTNEYRAFLTRRWGREGLRKFQARPVVRAFAIFLTYEFVSLSLLIIAYPWNELTR